MLVFSLQLALNTDLGLVSAAVTLETTTVRLERDVSDGLLEFCAEGPNYRFVQAEILPPGRPLQRAIALQ